MENRTLGFNSSHEYQSLRQEFLESKRYVFERPLLTVMALLAAAQFVDKYYLAFLPPIAISLLLFNFWFTISRLRSSSRIAAYIQVVLEECYDKNWVGWETFLRFHRKWLKVTGRKSVDKIIRDNLDRDAVPDALFFYPPLFYFHMVIVLLSISASVIYAYKNLNTESLIALVATVVVGIYFLSYSIKLRPSKMKGLIEEYRIITIEVTKYIKTIEKRETNTFDDEVNTEEKYEMQA